MSLPDGAEYWRDVKSHFRNKKRFTHLRELDCGHNGGFITWTIEDVSCYACKELFTDDIIAHANKCKDRADKRRLKKIKQKEKDQKASYVLSSKCPMCSCGEPMVKRTNRTSKEKFWGCYSWPNCSKTKRI